MCFNSELDLWQHKWKATPELAATLNTPEKALVHTDCDFFPNVHTLLCIMGTLPVTSCECERSISMLRLIKSPLRSTMKQEQLHGLAMLYYNRDVEITPDEAVDEFVKKWVWLIKFSTCSLRAPPLHKILYSPLEGEMW